MQAPLERDAQEGARADGPRVPAAASEERYVGDVRGVASVLCLERVCVAIAALGPVPVRPEHRRQGIGGGADSQRLQRCWALGLPGVIVFGSPAYYARFDFDRTDARDIRCELDVPPEACIVAWADGPMRGPAVARYHGAFSKLRGA